MITIMKNHKYIQNDKEFERKNIMVIFAVYFCHWNIFIGPNRNICF